MEISHHSWSLRLNRLREKLQDTDEPYLIILVKLPLHRAYGEDNILFMFRFFSSTNKDINCFNSLKSLNMLEITFSLKISLPYKICLEIVVRL